MKRFLLFYGTKYYPCGGWWDFKGSFETEAEAISALEKARVTPDADEERFPEIEWWHILDSETGSVNADGDSCYGNSKEFPQLSR